MTEKRFKEVVNGVKDTRTGRTLTCSFEVTMKLNEINNLYDIVFDRNEELEKENKKLKELIELIADAHSYTKEESVKEIVRHEIHAIDTVAETSADAWNDYCTLSNFFEEHYKESWDNYEE